MIVKNIAEIDKAVSFINSIIDLDERNGLIKRIEDK